MDEQIKPVATQVDYDCNSVRQYLREAGYPEGGDALSKMGAIEQSIDALRAEVERLRTLLADWHSQSTCKDGLRVQSPGHAHGKIGVWDDDNGAFAGVECAQCRLWAEAAAIDAARKGAE